MAPKPEENINNVGENLVLQKPESDLTGDEIVISGISGIFPKSNNVEEFMNNLYNKVDMVTSSEDHWPINHPEMPKHYGKVDDFDRFDAPFFRVPYHQAEYLDAMSRKLLENTYGAFFDAGVSPITLAGSNLGMFVGSSFFDSANILDISKFSNYILLGCSKTMQANRVSYWMDGRGLSFSVDETCGSSMTALEQAFWAIRKGRCSSAVVAGCSHFINPMLSFNLRRAGFLSLDGKTRCFDKNADGYVRSEAVSVIFLQRACEAKRIYAEVVYTKSKYGIRPDAHFLPIYKSDDIEDFLLEFYSEANIAPTDIEYVEASSIGIPSGDANELEAIGEVFADRKTIRVGSVKSNMGHSEGASSVCAVTKACLAYHRGELPANLHYNDPHDEVAAVREGRIQINTENVPFQRGYAAFNCFTYSGISHHTVLKGHYKKKCLDRYKSSIPRLILASGRIDDNVSKIFDSLKSQPVDAEQISLLNDFFAHDISGHTSRGYVIIDSKENKTVTLSESIDHYPGVTNPVWFMYSGMGSQWNGMGAELMKLPTFAASIYRCSKVLEDKGVDLVKIITSEDKTIFDNILNSFVGITAIQIALTDLMTEMGIVPDNIIGHSLGELGCAYADGCLTTEELMLASYYRGLVSIETTLIHGAMAAVNLGHEQVALICPPEIEVACHNSSQSSTISGPAEIVKEFVKYLTNQGIFAKEVNTANIAYHSKYIADAGPRLLSVMKEVITLPKLRTKKWICSSALPDKWEHTDVLYASAEYFVNNLLSNVYFYEAAKKIPVRATIIEISPHGLMQAILRKSHETCTNISLTRRGHPNPVTFLLEAVGEIYKIGLNPKIDFLYPKVQYPVSTETPLLSPLVGWAYVETWLLTTYKKQEEQRTSSRNFAMTLDDDDWEYIKGHVRNGTVIFPEAAILVLVWETLGMVKGLDYRNMPVIFELIRFDQELHIKKDEIIRFTIGILVGSNRFEVYQKGVTIATGFIEQIDKCDDEPVLEEIDINEDVVLTAKYIYKLLNMRGYSYKDSFQSILSTNTKRNRGSITWNNEWVLFLDSLLQLNILSQEQDGMLIPRFIRKLIINTQLHLKTKKHFIGDVMTLDAFIDDLSGATRCGGVQIEDVMFYNQSTLYNVADINSSKTIQLANSDVIDIKKRDIILIRNKSNSNALSWAETTWDIYSKNLIKVSYAGPSLHDYQNIIHNVNGNDKFGMDFSGYNRRGEKVMGLVGNGALASVVKADPHLLWPVPQHWSLEDAATVPLPYALAYYCLIIRGDLLPKERVLVIGGAGALGQAVISICLALNCSVFTTVGNIEKKRFLLRTFPSLPAEHINCTAFDATSFHPMVVKYTDNLLCNIVISCASGEIREQAMKCGGSQSYFMDVSVHDMIENMDFGMSYCWKARTYQSIQLSSILKPEFIEEKKILHRLITNGIAQGVVKPISRVSYTPAEVTNAFRYLVSNKRIGRVLIQMESATSLHNLKVTSPMNIVNTDTKETRPETKGLYAFLSYFECDEIQAAEPIVQMPSKIASCINKRTDEINSKETYLMMIPGFEGHSRIFTTVGERLKIQAVTLQLAPDLEGKTIPEMAENLSKFIKKIFEFHTKFYILGYSFGVNIALELAALLEREGYLGVVFCLDSSPDALRIQLDTYLGKITEEELQDLVVKDYFQLLSGKDGGFLSEELQNLENWPQKVKLCLKKLRPLVTYSHEYLRTALEAIYKRMKLAKEYEPKFKLKSEIVLMKAVSHSLKVENLTDDYNLSKYTGKAVRVFDLECDHLSAPYNCRISNIVNKMLEPELIAKFRRINLCEVNIDDSIKFERTRREHDVDKNNEKPKK